MNLVWLRGRIVGRGVPVLEAADAACRGLGLVETMLAEDGDVPWLDDHLARLASSAADLGLAGTPPGAAVERAVGELLDVAGSGAWRLRLTVGDAPTLVVELAPAPSPVSPGAEAISVRGAWLPERRFAEHKTTSYGEQLLAQRRAERAGAGHALLLDGAGRLGEAAIANAFCVVGETLLTAPARGLLPGIARARLLARAEVEIRAPREDEWRRASEIVLSNALRGVIPVVRVDGRPIGDGAVGPRARELARLLGRGTG